MCEFIKNGQTNEVTREFDFNGKLIKHVVILNPSKEKEALERFFNSFPQFMGREK